MNKLPAFVIALSQDEYKKASSRLSEAGIQNVHHFDAVNGKEEKEHYIGNRKKLTYRAEMEITKMGERECHSSMGSWGMVGCYQSHVELWKKASKSPDGLLIFESDVKPKNVEKVKRVFSDLKAKGRLDFFYLGYIGMGQLENEEVANRVVGRVYGTHAYYISPSFAAKLLQLCFPMEVQVDAFLGYVFLDKGVRAYALKEFDQMLRLKSSVQGKRVAGNPPLERGSFAGPVLAFVLFLTVATTIVFFLLRKKAIKM